ncbi:hypothetical protein PRIPAC_96362 [Pristionchus pacificus]|uniref:Uncharacterized protein n=1 Tax=Pristionchus pacificus TaxID=54126 RepID=A0A2A6B3C1_PRIPA|nr:hypothetical protein PRIPAC_96362 [Pristionchus pacificus]|eukprot:PDM60374.1 hypothetical protein PRIPAC_54199 [Pristionchus pacificus]
MIQWLLLGFFVVTVVFIILQCSRILYRAVPEVDEEDVRDDESDASGETEETDVSDEFIQHDDSAADPSSVEDSEVDAGQEAFNVVDETAGENEDGQEGDNIQDMDDVAVDAEDNDCDTEEVVRADVSSEAAISDEEMHRADEGLNPTLSLDEPNGAHPTEDQSVDCCRSNASSPLPSTDFSDSDDDVFRPDTPPVVPSYISFGPPPDFYDQELSHEAPRYFHPLPLASDPHPPPTASSPPLFCCEGRASWLPPFCVRHLNLLYAQILAVISRAVREEVFIHLGDVNYGRLLHDKYLWYVESADFFSGLFDLAHVYSLFLRAKLAAGPSEYDGERLMARWAGVQQLWIRLVQRTLQAVRREYERVLQAAYTLWLQQLQQQWAQAYDRWQEMSRLDRQRAFSGGYEMHACHQLLLRRQHERREERAALSQQAAIVQPANLEIDMSSLGYAVVEVGTLWDMTAIFAHLDAIDRAAFNRAFVVTPLAPARESRLLRPMQMPKVFTSVMGRSLSQLLHYRFSHSSCH